MSQLMETMSARTLQPRAEHDGTQSHRKIYTPPKDEVQVNSTSNLIGPPGFGTALGFRNLRIQSIITVNLQSADLFCAMKEWSSETRSSMSVRVCVLGSGSKGNSTFVATERTRILVDAGFNRRETYARLQTAGERTDGFDAILISHEHSDHVTGLRLLAIDTRAPICLTRLTHRKLNWDPKITAFEFTTPGQKFII